MQRLVAIVFLALFAGMVLRFLVFGDAQSHTFAELRLFERVLAIGGVVGAFGFWALMLADFFANGTPKRRVAWGFFLIFFSWLAAIIYFVLHFWPRHKRPTAQPV